MPPRPAELEAPELEPTPGAPGPGVLGWMAQSVYATFFGAESAAAVSPAAAAAARMEEGRRPGSAEDDEAVVLSRGIMQKVDQGGAQLLRRLRDDW